MATIRPPWMIQSAGRIDAKATPAKTGSQFIRENGGSLAPSYSGSFGGLNEFYHNQVAPTQHDKLQNQAQREQQAGGGFYRGGNASSEGIAEFNQQQKIGPVFPSTQVAGPARPVAPPLPAGINRGSSGVLDTFNKYGSGFSVGGDNYAGGPSDMAAATTPTPSGIQGPNGDGGVSRTMDWKKSDAANAKGSVQLLGQAVAAPAQQLGRQFAAPPQFAPRQPRPADDAGAEFDRATGNSSPRGRTYADRQAGRYFRENPGAAIHQRNIETQWGREDDRLSRVEQINSDNIAARGAHNVAVAKAKEAATAEKEANTDRRTKEGRDFTVAQKEAAKAEEAQKVAGENQLKGASMNQDLSVQQQRFGELYKNGKISESMGKTIANITDPKILKSTLDEHEATLEKAAKTELEAKKYEDSQRYKQGREARLKSMKPSELLAQTKYYRKEANEEEDPEQKAFLQRRADEAADALAAHPETGNPKSTTAATTAAPAQTAPTGSQDRLKAFLK